MERYTELAHQHRHLVEQTTPEGKAMMFAVFDRLLDAANARSVKPGIETQLPNSAEGEEHIERGSQ